MIINKRKPENQVCMLSDDAPKYNKIRSDESIEWNIIIQWRQSFSSTNREKKMKLISIYFSRIL